MSMQEVFLAIRKVKKYDPLITSSGWSDYAADKMKQVATQADRTAPQVEKDIIVFSAKPTVNIVHFAFRAKDPDGRTMIFNLSQAPMFPQFIGPLESAPPFIRQMTPRKKAA